ncbi:unnamed protein product [Microthlaspi erraticum]|uniref:MATH domain-containing protein n=1 Tax=Microthlaspi erraticum TaxID=1685480 RepID=A0A6D2L4Q2_9BRAS|nr:unnamed protein product [Microthlaspi erraticum]
MLRDLTESQHSRIHDDENPMFGYRPVCHLGQFKAKNGELLVSGEVSFGFKHNMFGGRLVTGKLYESKESEETTNPAKKTKLNVDVDGVQVLRSQVGFVRRLFEKHPDVALEFRSKNQHLRTGYISVLISLTQKLGQSPKELSNDDLSGVVAALTYMKDAGFKLDWLEKKLDQVKEKKKKQEACLAQLQEMEKELNPIKQKCLDLEAQMDKKKAELLEACAPDLSFD